MLTGQGGQPKQRERLKIHEYALPVDGHHGMEGQSPGGNNLGKEEGALLLRQEKRKGRLQIQHVEEERKDIRHRAGTLKTPRWKV